MTENIKILCNNNLQNAIINFDNNYIELICENFSYKNYMYNLTNCILNDNNMICLYFGNEIYVIYSQNSINLKQNIDKAKIINNQYYKNSRQKQNPLFLITSIIIAFLIIISIMSIKIVSLQNKFVNTETTSKIITENHIENNLEENYDKSINKVELTEKDIFIKDLKKSENLYNNSEIGYDKLYDILCNELKFKNIKYKEKIAPAVYGVEADFINNQKLLICVVMTDDNITDISCDTIILWQDDKVIITYDDILNKIKEQ